MIDALVDEGSFFELKKLYARELVTGFARLGGRAVGIVASQPKWKGGVLFVDSADKAARFIWLCDAFGLPLIFLADVPGFMIGKAVERQGIIRHGAKMISAVADATVPKICVVLRKAYGAGLYAMCGPGFEPDATIALPQAMIAVMGAEAAVNAVFANKIAEKPEAERAGLRRGAARAVPRRHRSAEAGRQPARRRRRAGRRAARRALAAARRGRRQERPQPAAPPSGAAGLSAMSLARWLTLIPADEARRILAETPPVGTSACRSPRRRGASWRTPSWRPTISRPSGARSWTASPCAPPTSTPPPSCRRRS